MIGPAKTFSSTMLWLKVALAVGLCLAGLSAALLAVGEARGIAKASVTCEKDKTKAVAQEHQQYVAEVARGASAVSDLQAQLDADRTEKEALNRRLPNVPRFVSTPSCPSAGDVSLTVAGLLRWNSALGYPGMPTSACGTDGTAAAVGAAGTDAACTAGSGVSIGAAQENAEVNFGRCAEIRTRCLALFEFIKTRPNQGQATKEISP